MVKANITLIIQIRVLLICNRFALESWHGKIQNHFYAIQNHHTIIQEALKRGVVDLIGVAEGTKKDEKKIVQKDRNWGKGKMRNSLSVHVCLEHDSPILPKWLFFFNQIIDWACLTHSSQHQPHSFSSWFPLSDMPSLCKPNWILILLSSPTLNISRKAAYPSQLCLLFLWSSNVELTVKTILV